MRKYRLLLVITIALFILINTAYFWEGMFSVGLLLVMALFGITYLTLLIGVFYNFYLSVKEKFKNSSRLFSTIAILILLILMFVKPDGYINFQSFEGPDLLTAKRGGVASCSTVLKLKKDHTFYMRQVCFGVEKFSGRYIIDNDTIRFQSDVTSRGEQYQYALVKPINLLGGNVGKEIMLFRSKKDTIPFTLGVDKDELTMGIGY